jgi:hypothetical protein
LYRDGKIINPASAILRQHALAATAKESGEKLKIMKDVEEERAIRIVKPDEATSGGDESLRKVDAVVAQSMAAYIAWHKGAGGWGASGI